MTAGDTKKPWQTLRESQRAQEEALHAVAAVLSTPTIVTGSDDWIFEHGTLRVGLGWYAKRGHSSRESIALAALQIWEGPRERVVAVERARRRETLLRSWPEAGPLIGAVSRAQAAAELCAAFPGFYAALTAALSRSSMRDLTVLPRHLQWAALVLQHSSASQRRRSATTAFGHIVAGEVAREWEQLSALGDGRLDPLARVMAPNPDLSALERFERALTLTLPPYTRLRVADEQDRGLSTLGDSTGASDGDNDEHTQLEDLSSLPHPDRDSDLTQDRNDASDSGVDSAAEEQELFESEHAEFTERFLSTPLPAQTAVAMMTEQLEIDRRERPESPLQTEVPTARAAADATALNVYRSRATHLAAEIEAVRALWERVIAERVAQRPATNRTPLPEGDTLATEVFASIVAETLAGVERPNAFLRRVSAPRRTRSVGSTDYVFVVDRSASMRGYIAEAAADAVLVMTEGLAAVERDIAHAEAVSGIALDLDIRTSLIAYGANAMVVKPLSHGLDDAVRRKLHAAIRAPEGSTNDSAALRAAAKQLGLARSRGGSESVKAASLVRGNGVTSNAGREKDAGSATLRDPGSGADALHLNQRDPLATLARHGGGGERRRIVILVSDGGSNDLAAAMRELGKLRAANVAVYGIGIGAEDIVERYAPFGRRIDDPRQLVRVLGEILETELP